MLSKSLVTALALVLPICASAEATDHLDVKGFHIGMQKWELEGHRKDFCYKDGCALSNKTPFTVGGVKGTLAATIYDDSAAADSIEFSFDSFGFQNLRNALLDKYPHAKCETSQVITRIGLKVPQVICGYETASEGIYLVRVAGNINKSLLLVMSAKKREEVRNRIEATNHDL